MRALKVLWDKRRLGVTNGAAVLLVVTSGGWRGTNGHRKSDRTAYWSKTAMRQDTVSDEEVERRVQHRVVLLCLIFFPLVAAINAASLESVRSSV